MSVEVEELRNRVERIEQRLNVVVELVKAIRTMLYRVDDTQMTLLREAVSLLESETL